MSMNGEKEEFFKKGFSFLERVKFHLLSQEEGFLLINNKLLWTKDFGNGWKDISPAQDSIIADAAFLNTEKGWVILLKGNSEGIASLQLAKTFDGGRTWEMKPLDLFREGDIDSLISHIFLSLMDERKAYIVTRRATSSAFRVGSLFKTEDGGNTWERLSIPIAEPVNFISEDFGWIIGGPCENLIYKTEDGGKKWQEIKIPCLKSFKNYRFKNLRFDNKKRGVLSLVFSYENSAFLGFYITENGGESWEIYGKIPIEDEFHPLTSYIFSVRKWIVIDISKMKIFQFETRTIGEKIEVNSSIPSEASVIEMDFYDEKIGWALIQDGILYRLLATKDGGLSWNEIFREEEIISLSKIYQGQGFDICQLPSPSALQKWKIYSPYYFINLYIGGASRACPNQPYLTKDNLLALIDQGWQGFVPTWVGPQAPCSNYRNRISSDPSIAYQQGKDEAANAIIEARKLGFEQGEPIYYDLEAYNTEDVNCRNAVVSFVKGWADGLRESGYIPGVYGSGCGSGMIDFPSIIDNAWLAHWIYSTYNPFANVWNVACVSDSFWFNHQRIRQYTGSHRETYGGVTLEIDCDVSDGSLAGVKAFTDNIQPTVNYFNVTPPLVKLGESFTISYTVSDSGGSGLNRIEVMRAQDINGTPGEWFKIGTNYLSGNGPLSGFLKDNPRQVGIYWYGIRVMDNAGNWSSEPNPPGPVRVRVTKLKKTKGKI